jgi:hypothetical protein
VHIDEVLSGTLRIYPNPTADMASLVLPVTPTADMTYEWLDATGRIISKGIQPRGKKSMEVSLRGLPAGLYLIRIHGTDGQLSMGKLVKY